MACNQTSQDRAMFGCCAPQETNTLWAQVEGVWWGFQGWLDSPLVNNEFTQLDRFLSCRVTLELISDAGSNFKYAEWKYNTAFPGHPFSDPDGVVSPYTLNVVEGPGWDPSQGVFGSKSVVSESQTSYTHVYEDWRASGSLQQRWQWTDITRGIRVDSQNAADSAGVVTFYHYPGDGTLTPGRVSDGALTEPIDAIHIPGIFLTGLQNAPAVQSVALGPYTARAWDWRTPFRRMRRYYPTREGSTGCRYVTLTSNPAASVDGQKDCSAGYDFYLDRVPRDAEIPLTEAEVLAAINEGSTSQDFEWFDHDDDASIGRGTSPPCCP